MSETVPNDIRDEVMSDILAKPPNQICFDCGSKAPNWSSPYLGIVICYECAARHRSYGTHISFVRSVDLDKWNRKQLKSLQLTGNAYTKQRFNDLGVPLIGNIYDYNNSMVLKVRQEIADKVKEALKPDEFKAKNDKNKSEDNNNKIDFEEEELKIKESKEKENKKEQKKEDEEEKEEKEEIKKPTKFEVNSKAKVKVKNVGKAGKKNKIKKVDFDFDFDSFNDVNFGDLNQKDDKDEDNEKNQEKDDIDNKQKEDEKVKEKEEGYNNYDIKMSKKEINKKFANKKAISSEDYAALENDNSDNKATKNKIRAMGNSQAISSDDVFGTGDGSNAYEGESMTDKLKDMALNFTLGAAEKAKELKKKTGELINKVQNKFSGTEY
jgi:hypothetical protein